MRICPCSTPEVTLPVLQLFIPDWIWLEWSSLLDSHCFITFKRFRPLWWNALLGPCWHILTHSSYSVSTTYFSTFILLNTLVYTVFSALLPFPKRWSLMPFGVSAFPIPPFSVSYWTSHSPLIILIASYTLCTIHRTSSLVSKLTFVNATWT